MFLGNADVSKDKPDIFHHLSLQRVNGFEKTISLQLVMGIGLQVGEIRGYFSQGEEGQVLISSLG